jgi:hypothetical protein
LKEDEMRFLAKFLGIALLAAAGIGLVGWVVMALWNAVLPGVVIGVHAIDYRQALCLLVLSRILCGGSPSRQAVAAPRGDDTRGASSIPGGSTMRGEKPR